MDFWDWAVWKLMLTVSESLGGVSESWVCASCHSGERAGSASHRGLSAVDFPAIPAAFLVHLTIAETAHPP